MLRPGFEPGICDSKVPHEGNVRDLNVKSVREFKNYLESQNTSDKTINEIFRNAIKYHHILYEGNASELTTYSTGKRKHIMKALAAFSKFSGCYDTWQNIRKQYQLKWTSTDSLAGFHNMLKQDGDFTSMVDWIKKAINENQRFSNVFKFNVMTGLRPAEAIESFNLLVDHKKRQVYLSKDQNMIEHFKFPDTFLRKTKKAFVSLMTDNMFDLINTQKESLNYDIIRLTFLRNNQKFYMSYCRKIFATFLRNEGIEPELIDLLQGRIPNSVFVRHYYRPYSSKFDEVRKKLDKLHDILLD